MSHYKLQNLANINNYWDELDYLHAAGLCKYIKSLLKRSTQLEIQTVLPVLIPRKSNELSIFEEQIDFFIKNHYSLTISFDESEKIEKAKLEIENEFIANFLLSVDNGLSKEISIIDPGYIEKYDKVSKKLEILLSKLEVNSNYLYCFERRTYYSELVCFDIKQQTLSREHLQYYQFDRSIFTAQLPSNELLSAGCEVSNSFWIMDINTGKVKKEIRLNNSLFQMHPTYYRNYVYIFGGYYSMSSRLSGYLAMRVDLIKGRCFNLPWLLRESTFCSSVAFKDTILLCSQNQAIIYQFDILIASYSEIYITYLKDICVRIIFNGNSRLYLIDRNKILESEVENQYVWASIGSAQIGDFSNSSRVYNKGSVYIVTQNYRGALYYKFNLEKRQLEPIVSNVL